MRSIAITILLTAALLGHLSTLRAQEFPLGEGQVKIDNGTAINLMPSYKFYPGDKLRLKISDNSKVRHNWQTIMTEDCFLFIFCTDVPQTIHNERKPEQLPINTFLAAPDDSYLNSNGTILGKEEQIVTIPTNIAFDKAYSLKGFFGDYPKTIFPDGIYIDRTHSDGAYTVNVYLDATARIAKFTQLITTKGAGLTFEDINGEDVLNSTMRNFYKTQIAKILAAHCRAFSAMDNQEKHSVLKLALLLDAANPEINIAVAESYLQTNNLNQAELEARTAIRKIQAGSNDPLQLADAYMTLAMVHGQRGEGMIETKVMEATATFGKATDLYLAANRYPEAVRAMLWQAKCLKSVRDAEHLEAAAKVMERAYALQTETMLVERNNKFGLIDGFGQIVLAPTYDSIKNSRAAMLPALTNGKWGYINKLGSQVLAANFDDAWAFKDNIARVYQNGGYHYIDPKGTPLFNESYKWASDFHARFAAVETTDGNFFLMNTRGEKFANIPRAKMAMAANIPLPVGPNPNISLESIENGLMRNRRAGEILVNNFVMPFRPNGNYRGRKIIAYNKNDEPSYGNTQWPGDYGFIDVEGNILALPDGRRTTVGYTDSGYDITHPTPQINEFYRLDHNLQPVNFWTGGLMLNILSNGFYNYLHIGGDGKWGLANKQGQQVLQAKFDAVYGIYGTDYAYTLEKDKLSLYQGNGALISTYPRTEQKPTSIFPLLPYNQPPTMDPTPSRLLLQLPTGNGVIDLKGQIIVEPKYAMVSLLDLAAGLYQITDLEGKQGIYQPGKGWLIPLGEKSLYYSAPNNTVTFIENDKLGLMDMGSQTLLSPTLEHINYLADTLLAVKQKGSWYLHSYSGKQLWAKPCKGIFPVIVQQDNIPVIDMTWGVTPGFIPYITTKFIDRSSELAIFKAMDGRFGVYSMLENRELIPAQYDTILCSANKFWASKKTTAKKGPVLYDIYDYSGIRFIPNEVIFPSYNPFLNLFSGISPAGKVTWYDGSSGKALMSAEIVKTGSLMDALETMDYSWKNVTLSLDDKPVVMAGPFGDLRTGGKLFYLFGNKEIWQIDPYSTYRSKIVADDIQLPLLFESIQ